MRYRHGTEWNRAHEQCGIPHSLSQSQHSARTDSFTTVDSPYAPAGSKSVLPFLVTLRRLTTGLKQQSSRGHTPACLTQKDLGLCAACHAPATKGGVVPAPKIPQAFGDRPFDLRAAAAAFVGAQHLGSVGD